MSHGLRVGPIDTVARAIQGNRQRRDRLGGLIVQLTSEAAALVFLGRDRLAQHLSQALRPFSDADLEITIGLLDRLVCRSKALAHRLEALGQLSDLVLGAHADWARE